MNALDRLISLQGKPVDYRDKRIVMDKITERDGTVYIDYKEHLGPDGQLQKDLNKLSLFLEVIRPLDIEPIEEEVLIEKQEPKNEIVPVQSHNKPSMLAEHGSLFNKMRDMLMEDMEKVRQDPKYIPQAKQSSNTANSIINLARLELSIRREE